MPANRAILSDIATKNLNPKVEYKTISRDGHIKNPAKKQLAPPHVVPEQLTPSSNSVLKETNTTFVSVDFVVPEIVEEVKIIPTITHPVEEPVADAVIEQPIQFEQVKQNTLVSSAVVSNKKKYKKTDLHE